MRLDFIVRMAVGKKQIRRSVVVIIKKLPSPPPHKTRHPANSIGNSHIIEGLIAIVVIKGVHLLVHVGNKQVHPAILVVIRGVDSHPGPWPPLGAVTNIGLQAYFLELPVAAINRSEERRVGKECRFRWSPDHEKKKTKCIESAVIDVSLCRA